MKRREKLIILLLIMSFFIGFIPSIVKATDVKDLPFCQDDDIYVAWTIKDKNGNEVQNITGGGDYGLQDLSIPGYNDYTNCYFELVVNEYIGKQVNIDNFGTFTYTEQTRNEDDMNWYIYKFNISDPSKYNKPTSEAKSFNFEITVERTGKSYQVWLDYNVIGERKIYEVKNNTVSIAVEASSDKDLSLKADEISKESNTYLQMIEYINKKCDNECLGSFDISLVGGDYKGNLEVTFMVGEQYNGKKVLVCHKKSDGTYEYFENNVKNGKVSITVNELSPFMISLVKEENTANNSSDSSNNESQNEQENKKELDETPKTGVTDVVYYVLPVVFISAVGIVVFRKKSKK